MSKKMSKTTGKGLLIDEDKSLLSLICKDTSQYLPLLEKLKKKYDSLQLGEFDNEIFKELINDGSGGVIEKYHQSLERQLNTLKIKSKIMRKNLVAEHNIYIENFKKSLLLVTSFMPHRFSRNVSPTLELNYISYHNGTFQILSEDIEAITDKHCRTYLSTEIEVRAYKTIIKLNESYGDLKDIMSEIGYNRFRGFESMHLFIKDVRIPEVRPKEVKEMFNQVEKQRLYNKDRVIKQS